MHFRGLIKVTTCVVCVLAVITAVTGQPQQSTMPNRVATVNFPHVADMDMEGKYVLRWGFNATHIRFEAQAHTQGYVGFGVSKSGTMVPADVVVGYVADGNVILVDYHTERYSHPVQDRSQDWVLDYGYEADGWTVLAFTRLLDTCDTVGDIPITRDTQHLIYSYHAQDPPNHQQLMFHQHRGAKPINLLTLSPPPSQPTTDAEVVEFRNNFSIPLQDSAHHCRLFSLAGTSIANTKHHIIKIDPIFPDASAYNVHKLTLYRCRFPDLSVLDGAQQYDCFRDGAGHQQHCKEYVAGFVPGGQEFYLPEDVGLPFGGSDMADLYVLATEYHNENFDNVVDTSGVRLWFTPTLRPHDAAFMTIATPIAGGWYQFIPSGDEAFVQKAYCPQACMKWGFDATTDNRITLIGARFQGRDLARAMRLRHLTSGREEPWVLDNRKYSHRAQSVQLVEQRRTISSTDALLLECTYNTTTVTANFTVGGWGSQDELCRAHVLYYPPIPLEGCLSWSLYNTLRDASGQPIPSNQVFDVLKTGVDWRDSNMRQFLRQTLDTSAENTQCWSSRQTPSMHSGRFNQPEVPNPYTKPNTSTCPRV